MIPDEFSTMVEKTQDDVLRATFHSAQRSIQSVIYNVVDQVMAHLLSKYVLWETRDAHQAKLFDNDAAIEGFRRG